MLYVYDFFHAVVIHFNHPKITFCSHSFMYWKFLQREMVGCNELSLLLGNKLQTCLKIWKPIFSNPNIFLEIFVKKNLMQDLFMLLCLSCVLSINQFLLQTSSVF